MGRDSRAIVSWYGSVYSPKAFDPVNGLGFFMKDPIEEIETAYQELFQVLSGYKEFLGKQKIPLYIFLLPQVFQVQEKNWEWALAEYGLKKSCFDLNEPNKRIMDFCNKAGLNCIDPTTRMKQSHIKTTTNYYLPLGDMHWNAEGHRAFVDAVWKPLFHQIKTNS